MEANSENIVAFMPQEESLISTSLLALLATPCSDYGIGNSITATLNNSHLNNALPLAVWVSRPKGGRKKSHPSKREMLPPGVRDKRPAFAPFHFPSSLPWGK